VLRELLERAKHEEEQAEEENSLGGQSSISVWVNEVRDIMEASSYENTEEVNARLSSIRGGTSILQLVEESKNAECMRLSRELELAAEETKKWKEYHSEQVNELREVKEQIAIERQQLEKYEMDNKKREEELNARWLDTCDGKKIDMIEVENLDGVVRKVSAEDLVRQISMELLSTTFDPEPRMLDPEEVTVDIEGFEEGPVKRNSVVEAKLKEKTPLKHKFRDMTNATMAAARLDKLRNVKMPQMKIPPETKTKLCELKKKGAKGAAQLKSQGAKGAAQLKSQGSKGLMEVKRRGKNECCVQQ